MEILRTEHLTKTYGTGEAQVKALKDVSFALEKGEFAAVVGESGSGKTTLLNCIGGLDTPTSGKVLLDGQDIFSMKMTAEPYIPFRRSRKSGCPCCLPVQEILRRLPRLLQMEL